MHVPILKVEIAVPKERWRKLVDALAYWENFHVEEYDGEHRFPLTEEEEEERRKARKVLNHISEIESIVGPIDELPVSAELKYEEVKRVRDEFAEVGKAIAKLKEEERRLADYLALSKNLPEGKKVIAVVLARNEISSKAFLVNLLEQWGLNYDERSVGDKTLVVIDAPEDRYEEILNELQRRGFTILRPPKGYSSLAEVQRALTEEIPRKLKELERVLSSLKERYLNFLREQKFVAKDIINVLRLKEKSFSASKFMAFLKGWIPAPKVDELRALLKRVDRNAFLHAKHPEVAEYERVPVALKNRPPLSWFQSLLDIYAPPVYRTFDPTVIIAFFFPLYYGFMLGDAGYGLVGMFLFWVLAMVSKPGSQGRNLSMVYFINSLMAVIFGLIFGEIFGDWGIKMGLIEPLFHRTHNGMDLLFIAIGFGFFQILLSMLIGVWNNWILRHTGHALFELGRFFAILGILLLIAPNLGAIGIERPWLKSISALSPVLTPLGAISFVLGAILVFIGEAKSGGVIKGMVGQIEIFSAFGNVLSYARLAAVGLASAILAEIANHFADIVPVPIFALTVVVAFHALAFVLGVVDPTIQGMRLQFVESFTKFFLPASRIFTPIRKGGRI
ncbi:MAG: hypothetical protein GXO29_00205 [Thermotogae bacterium]|nr:hypothetical protein [Thermotogota bacterium]